MGNINTYDLKSRHKFQEIIIQNELLLKPIDDFYSKVKLYINNNDNIDEVEVGFAVYLSRLKSNLIGINVLLKEHQSYVFPSLKHSIIVILRSGFYDLYELLYAYSYYLDDKNTHKKVMSSYLDSHLGYFKSHMDQLFKVGVLSKDQKDEFSLSISKNSEKLKHLDKLDKKFIKKDMLRKVYNSETKNLSGVYESYLILSKVEHFGLLSNSITHDEELLIQQLLNYSHSSIIIFDYLCEMMEFKG